MYQKWRSLLFLHWVLPPGQVRPLVPPGLELDLFGGDAYVGLVLFTMRGVRPAGLPPVPWLSNFHETNLRTYVHAGGRDPGVWFFSLEAANPLAVVLARSLFHLPYHHARMGLDKVPGAGPPGDAFDDLTYRSRRLWPGPVPATSSVACRVPRRAPSPSAVGTPDHFLIERYLLYATCRGRLLCGQVHHRPYPVQSAELLALDETLMDASGLLRPDNPPLVHFSCGVDVEIFSLRSVPAF
jgi:uncharacterized protein YqjF (DUF2071 family)